MTLVESDLSISELPFEIHRNLCLKLENNKSWIVIAEYLNKRGLSLNIDFLKAQACSSERLLQELGIRICDVGTFCKILEDCELFHALAVLRKPEPVKLIEEPADGRESIQVVYRGTLELLCKAWSLPPPLYQWCRDNAQIADSTSSQLCIPNFSPDLEGRYYCKVRADEQGSQEIYSHEVDVSIAPILPEIKDQPEGIVRQQGETICLKYRTEAYPSPTYQWYRENQLLNGQDKSTLYINYAKPEDSGLYRCIASNKAGDVVSEIVTVQVIGLDIPLLTPIERCTAKEKVAMLIGNVKYENHDCLVKPVDDVVLLSKMLTDIGFKVITLINLRLVEMRNALQQFSHQLTPGVYGLFYYGGHGTQADERLILPIDAPKDYGPEHCLCEKQVKDVMLTKNPAVRVIILDMCLRPPHRPIVSSQQSCKSSEDFVAMPDIDLILAYSTSGNLSAYERRSESNGTYVKHLSKFITEDISMIGVFQKTHAAIYNETVQVKDVTQQQIPMLLNNVYKKYCFTDCVSGDPDIERFFNSIFTPPKNGQLDFNPSTRAMVHYKRHREHILNVLEIEIRGIDLDVWNLKVCSQKEILQMEIIPIKEAREGDIFKIVVEDLQGSAVASNLSLTINLKDSQNSLVGSTQIFLDNPLIANLFLWVDPSQF